MIPIGVEYKNKRSRKEEKKSVFFSSTSIRVKINEISF